MIFYYQSKNILRNLDLQATNALVYPDIQDLRNYAFLYIYPNNDFEGVIRTQNLTEHYYALLPLTKQSKYLHQFKSALQGDELHFYFDELVVKSGTLQIYYSTSNLSDDDAFGYINVPSVLTDFQKQFIQQHIPYFKSYQEILINQFDENQNHLIELNSFGDQTFITFSRSSIK